MFGLKNIDYLFGYFILILMSNGFISLLTADVDDALSTRESGLLVFLLLVCYAYYILRTIHLYKKALYLLSKSTPVVALLLYMLINAVSSEYTLFALQKVAALILTIYVALCFSLLYTKYEMIRMVSFSVLILLASSFAFGILLPSIGIHNDEFHEGSWRGVFPQKQVLGQIALLGFLFGFVFRKYIKVQNVYILLSLSFVLLYLSQSRTAWLVCIICLFFYKYIAAKNMFKSELRAAISISFSFLLISLTYHIYLNFAEVLDLLGKDATLTGRSTLWEYTLDVAVDNRWIGVGYKSFWQNQSDLMFIYFGYFAVNGHNFILDSYLELGLIGLLFIAILFADNFRMTFRSNDSDAKLWSFTIMLYILLVGQVATIFPNQNSIVTFLFFVSYYGLIKNEKK
jgi:exopolysaccharide production protein ExoQ